MECCAKGTPPLSSKLLTKMALASRIEPATAEKRVAQRLRVSPAGTVVTAKIVAPERRFSTNNRKGNPAARFTASDPGGSRSTNPARPRAQQTAAEKHFAQIAAPECRLSILPCCICCWQWIDPLYTPCVSMLNYSLRTRSVADRSSRSAPGPTRRETSTGSTTSVSCASFRAYAACIEGVSPRTYEQCICQGARGQVESVPAKHAATAPCMASSTCSPSLDFTQDAEASRNVSDLEPLACSMHCYLFVLVLVILVLLLLLLFLLLSLLLCVSRGRRRRRCRRGRRCPLLSWFVVVVVVVVVVLFSWLSL